MKRSYIFIAIGLCILIGVSQTLCLIELLHPQPLFNQELIKPDASGEYQTYVVDHDLSFDDCLDKIKAQRNTPGVVHQCVAVID